MHSYWNHNDFYSSSPPLIFSTCCLEPTTCLYEQQGSLQDTGHHPPTLRVSKVTDWESTESQHIVFQLRWPVSFFLGICICKKGYYCWAWMWKLRGKKRSLGNSNEECCLLSKIWEERKRSILWIEIIPLMNLAHYFKSEKNPTPHNPCFIFI